MKFIISKNNAIKRKKIFSLEKQKELYRTYYKYIINLNVTILLILNFKFYILSLKKCIGSIYYCLSNEMFLSWLLIAMIYYFISTFITSILIFLSIHKYISRYYLISIIVFHLIISIKERGEEPARHGTINTLFLPFALLLYLSIIELIYNFIKWYRKKSFVTFAITIQIILYIIIYFEIRLRLACKGWEKGLGNSEIDFFSQKTINENGCYPSKPVRCLLPLIDNKIKLNNFIGSGTCDFKANDKKELIKYAPHLKNSKNIAFPLIKFKDVTKEIYGPDLAYWILNGMYDLDNRGNVSEDYKNYEPEAIVHFDEKDKGTLEIKVNRNETLIKEKLKIINETKNEPVKSNNILILYIDSISRVQFLKKMPLTTSVIEKYYNNDISNLKNEKYITFQFLKYLNFEVKTSINTTPMFTGVPWLFDEKNPEYGIHITKYLDQHGYITAFSNEQCAKILYDLTPDTSEFISFYPFDHEINEIFCDPHYVSPDKIWNNLRGTNSIVRRCLYGKETYKYVFDFGEKFLKTYEDYPRKFLRLAFQQAHETFMEIIKLMDKDFSDFLSNFIEKYYDKDWAIFIISDHGNGLTVFRGEDWRKEISFAALFLLLPNQSFQKYNLSSIRENEQKIVTPYDIHNTLLDMIGYNKTYFNKKGNSTLDVVDSKYKTCQFYVNEMRDIRKSYCTCIPY